MKTKRWERLSISKQKHNTMIYTALYVSIAMMLMAAIVILTSLLYDMHVRQTVKKADRLDKIMNKVMRISKYNTPGKEAEEQAARKLACQYQAIFNNPFVAIAIYDSNNKLVEQNDKMKDLPDFLHSKEHRQALFNAEGQIDCYLVTVNVPW